jgi:uncharacterized protein YkwD
MITHTKLLFSSLCFLGVFLIVTVHIFIGVGNDLAEIKDEVVYPAQPKSTFTQLAELTRIAPQPVNKELFKKIPVTPMAGVIEEVNAYRESKGLNTLKSNPQLVVSAQLKANDMTELNYWAHDSPKGKNAGSFMREAGYPQKHWGENLARCFQTAKGIVNAWINSPSHDRVLNGKYTEAAFAMSYNIEDNCYYVAGHFGIR